MIKMGGSVLVGFLNFSRNSKLSKILKFRKRYHEENGTNQWKVRQHWVRNTRAQAVQLNKMVIKPCPKHLLTSQLWATSINEQKSSGTKLAIIHCSYSYYPFSLNNIIKIYSSVWKAVLVQ